MVVPPIFSLAHVCVGCNFSVVVVRLVYRLLRFAVPLACIASHSDFLCHAEPIVCCQGARLPVQAFFRQFLPQSGDASGVTSRATGF